jgi:hypothetical protein
VVSDGKHVGFGHYGRLGNSFGETQIQNVSIDSQVYLNFTKRQIRSALDSTLLFLALFFE